MHGPLICYECRIFLKEDEAHEKEQHAYEERRQAKYKKQLAGETEVMQTDKEESTKEDRETPDEHTHAVARSPSPPREVPQNFTRITLTQVFTLGLQDKNVFKTTREDGTILTPRTQHIPLHLNRFACLPTIQDLPPIPRWTTHTLLFHIAYLHQRRETKRRLSEPGKTACTPIVYLPARQNLQPAFSEQTLTEDSHFEAGTISKSQLDGTTTTRKTLRQLVTTVRIDPVSPSNILAGGSDTTTRMDTQRTPENTPIFNLTEPITLREGQRVIVNGQHFTLRGTTKDSPSHQHTTTNTNDLTQDSPAEGHTSEESVDTYFQCYIPPEINESNAESVEREMEIQRRIAKRQRRHLPDRSNSRSSQRKDDTQQSTNIESVPPYVTSPTVNEGKDIGNTSNSPAHKTSMTVAMKHGNEEGSPRSGKDGVNISLGQARHIELSDWSKKRCHDCETQQMQQLVQTITLDDLNPHGLYPNPDTPLSPQDITVLYDSGASITMLPGTFKDSWRNLRPSMMSLSGAFTDTSIQSMNVGKFHAQMTLDNGETIRVVIPEAICLPDSTTTYLLCDTQFLLAGHEYISDLRAPKLKMVNGKGTYTMDIIDAHKVIKLLSISAHEETNNRTILLHLPTPYEPPTFYNNATI